MWLRDDSVYGDELVAVLAAEGDPGIVSRGALGADHASPLLPGHRCSLLALRRPPDGVGNQLLRVVGAEALSPLVPPSAARAYLALGASGQALCCRGLNELCRVMGAEHGLPVVYTPYGPTESTAEHAFLLILSAARHLPMLDSATRKGDFDIRNRPQSMGIELRGKTLGVVGFGRIGRRLAHMCQAALDMPVCAYDPYLDPECVTEWGATPVDNLVELARQVDVLSLHIPATAETHHLVNKEVIQALKPSAILVNAARGAVVDEAALVEALQAGHIHGAGIDVYSPEPPPPDNPLFQLDRVVLTPHVASKTKEARMLMGLTVVEDIISVLKGHEPQYLANPEVWPNRRFS